MLPLEHLLFSLGPYPPLPPLPRPPPSGAPDPLPGPQPWNPTADDAWLLPQYPAYHTFVRSHLGVVGPHAAPTIHLRAHRGISVALFHNPHHATRWGLLLQTTGLGGHWRPGQRRSGS